MDDSTRNVPSAVFVLDGGDSARAASAAARLLPTDTEWAVLAIVAEHPQYTSGATGFAGPVLSPDEMDERAQADLVAGDAAAAATARAFGGRPVVQAAVRGLPADAVVVFAAEHPIDLVVVDSSDLATDLIDGGFRVLVMPQEHSGSTEHRGSADGPVLLALDGSSLDDVLVATAGHLLGPSFTYLALHVEDARSIAQSVPVATLTPGAPGEAMVSALADNLEAASVEAERVADESVADLDAVDAETVGEAGDPASSILAVAEEHDASILVVGSRDHSWLSQLLRPSVTEAVLERTQRPVLLVGDPPEGSTEADTS